MLKIMTITVSFNSILPIIEKKTGGKIPEDIQFLLEMYCHGSITMTVEWAVGGMKMAPTEMADILIDAPS